LIDGLIFDVKRFSIHDGPGIRTTIFFKGCPLRCLWCHNPESQSPKQELMVRTRRCIGCGACLDACRHGAITAQGQALRTDGELCRLCGACVEVCYAEAREMVGRVVTVEEMVAEAERDVAFYDQSGGGVTLSGGEPLAQPEFLVALARMLQERGITTALDTCGHAPWTVLERVRRYVDLFLYDLKIMDEARHQQLTGNSNRAILENLQTLSVEGERIVVRVPLIPGINDDAENLERLGAFIARLPQVERVDLLPYHPTARDKYKHLARAYELSEVRRPSGEGIDGPARILRNLGLCVRIGG
jgi:pyruvate formate lyase activating enzyme